MKKLLFGIVVFGMMLLPTVASAQEPVSTVPPEGFAWLTIKQDLDPNKNNVQFRYDVNTNVTQVDDFFLFDDDTSPTFEVAEGTYAVVQRQVEGWESPSVTCKSFDEVRITNGVRLDLESGDIVVCTFDNDKLRPTATPTKTATVTPTNTSVPVATATQQPFPTVDPLAVALLELANAQKAVPQTQSQSQTVIVEAPQVPVLKITAPNTGDGGLLN